MIDVVTVAMKKVTLDKSVYLCPTTLCGFDFKCLQYQTIQIADRTLQGQFDLSNTGTIDKINNGSIPCSTEALMRREPPHLL